MSFDHPHRCGTPVLSRVSVRFSPLVVFVVVTVRGLDHLGRGRLLQPGPNPQQPAGDSPDSEHRNDDPERSGHGAIVRLRPAVWADTHDRTSSEVSSSMKRSVQFPGATEQFVSSAADTATPLAPRYW